MRTKKKDRAKSRHAQLKRGEIPYSAFMQESAIKIKKERRWPKDLAPSKRTMANQKLMEEVMVVHQYHAVRRDPRKAS